MRVLLLNQTIHPDVVATAQMLSDFAIGLHERGHPVTAIASRRAYERRRLAVGGHRAGVQNRLTIQVEPPRRHAADEQQRENLRLARQRVRGGMAQVSGEANLAGLRV